MRGVVGGLALALTGALAGCGEGDPFQAYCDEVTAQQPELTRIMAEPGPTALIEARPHFDELAEKAPQDIRDDWRLVTERIRGLEQALDEAGVDPADYDRSNPPSGVTDEQREAIDAAARELTEPETVTALEHVQQQARDVCKTSLSLS